VVAECTVYCLAWSPDSEAVVYPRGGVLVVAPLAAAAKPLQWKAHEAPILAVDWSPATNRIVSGGEDGKYKVGAAPRPPKAQPPTILAAARNIGNYALGTRLVNFVGRRDDSLLLVFFNV
jgi:hypothetical protein